MRILQVGAGGFGAVWLRALRDDPAFELVTLVDQDPAALAAAPTVPRFVDLDAALQASDADLALVVVPPSAHREVAERCLAAGLPVLVEKPLAGTREDCEALIEAAERADRQLAVSQNYRYRPAIETARRAVAELGPIGQAQVDFRIHHDFRGTFREQMEHPLLLDMAVHSFDLIRFITGLEAVDVQAHTWNPPWSQFEGDASALALFTMDSGARVAYSGSWHPRGQFTDWNCRWLIECERGYLTLDRDVVRVYRGDDAHRPGTRADEEIVPLVAMERTDQAAVLADFAAAIREDRPAPTNALDNLRTVEMVLAAVEASDVWPAPPRSAR